MSKRVGKRAVPTRVNFYYNALDLQCWLLFNAGLYDWAIAEVTGLTVSQVGYRIAKVRKNLGDAPAANARKMYRSGQSPLVRTVMTLVGTENTKISNGLIGPLKKAGLYLPNKNETK